MSITDLTKINRPGYYIRMYSNERIFDSRLLMYNKIFLEKLYFIVHEHSSVENSFSTYVLWMLYPGWFILVESVHYSWQLSDLRKMIDIFEWLNQDVLTGMEAGLLTTTKSSSMWTILISSDDTGTSCLKKKSWREKFLFSGKSDRISLLIPFQEGGTQVCPSETL